MATNRINVPNDGWSQAKQRSLAIFYDQHKDGSRFPNGRPWWCHVERPADGAAMPMPVGELQPHGWFAPWYPDQKYIIMGLNRLSDNHFRIDYQRMITDYTAAMREYYSKAVREAISLNLPAPEYNGVIGYRLAQIVGEPPKSPKIPEAALAGDRWLLGFHDEPNEALERLLVTGNALIATPEQSVSHGDEIAALKKQLDELMARSAAPVPVLPVPRRRGRPPKAKTEQLSAPAEVIVP